MHHQRKVILLLDASREHARAFLSGVARFSRLQAGWVFIKPPPFWERAFQPDALEFIRAQQPNGIIMEEVSDMSPIMELGIPLVVSNCFTLQIPGAINAIGSQEAVGAMAADHLVACGFRRFAFCGNDIVHWSQSRRLGFERSLARNGFNVEASWSATPEQTGKRAGRKSALSRWLANLPKPIGIMTCNDDRSQQLIEACRIMDLSVPEKIGIIGVDNDPVICDLSPVTLSSVAMNTESVGFEAAGCLDRLMRTRHRCLPVNITGIRPTHVVQRISTDIVNVDDPVLGKAIRYIRTNGKLPMQVASVVAASGASRRSLERRFKASFGRSIQKEIRRVRVACIESYLAETNLSIAGIADRLGLPSGEHFARYFRSETGISPRAFRKRIHTT